MLSFVKDFVCRQILVEVTTKNNIVNGLNPGVSVVRVV